MYTTMAFAALLMGVGLAWRRHVGLLLYAAGLALGLYVNYLAFPLWVGLSVIWLVLWWQRGHRYVTLLLWLVATAAAWWLYRPWWPHFQTWLQGAVVNHWMVGRIRTSLGLEEVATWHFLLALGLAAAALLGAAVVVPVILRRARWRRVITVLTILGFGAFLILTPIPRLYGLKRVLVTGWPFVILFVAWLVSNLQRRRRLLTQALLGLSLLAALVTLLLVPKDDWRGVSAYLQRQMDAGDVLWIEPGWNWIPLEYYGIEERVQTTNETDLQALAATHDEVWIVAERFHGQPVPSSSGERWLNDNWQLQESESFYRLEVRHYLKRRPASHAPWSGI